METNFAPTFFDSVKRLVNRQRWYWKTWDFLRYDMPRFFRNLWIFRKDLYNYRWYSGQNAVLPFMKTALTDMAARIDERGMEVEYSKSKKVDSKNGFVMFLVPKKPIYDVRPLIGVG